MSVVIKDDIMQGSEQFAPVAYKLVSTAKASSSKVADPELSKVSWRAIYTCTINYFFWY